MAAAFYDRPARYKATRRGWIPGPKVSDPSTPLARGTGARLIEPGEEFEFDGRPGSWMSAAEGDGEAKQRVAEAEDWREEQERIAKVRAQADVNGTAMLLAQVQALTERLEAIEGGKRHGSAKSADKH